MHGVLIFPCSGFRHCTSPYPRSSQMMSTMFGFSDAGFSSATNETEMLAQTNADKTVMWVLCKNLSYIISFSFF